MERSEPFAYLSEHELPSMLGVTMAVLVLMRPSSRRCAVYQAEIE